MRYRHFIVPCRVRTLHIMDVDFFKARQKALGLTTEDLGRAIGRDRTAISKMYSGGRLLKPEEVRGLAEALQLTVDEVLDHAGMKEPAIVRSIAQAGFAESEAKPFDWQGRGGERAALSSAFNLNRPGVEVWSVQGRSMDLAGYLEGDAILVDRLRADRAKAGDDVIAQVYDFATGSARTVFRRYDPPFIFPVSTDQAELKPQLVDNDRIVVVGVVTLSWRTKDKL